MKKFVAFAFLALSLSLILLPALTSVNQSPNTVGPIVADGNPLPSPIPPKGNQSILLADGNPLPSPIPPKGNQGIFLV